MKVELVTKEEFTELKQMMQEILSLLRDQANENLDWTDSKGMQKMLGCSESGLSNYRNSGILPFAKHGGKIFYSKKAVNDILKSKMNMQESLN